MKKTFILGVIMGLLCSCLPIMTNQEINDDGSPWQEMTMLEWLHSSYNTNYTAYLTAVEACGYDEVISANRNYTFIMPDNSALSTYARMQGKRGIEEVDAEVLNSLLKYLTVAERFVSTDFEEEEARLFTTEADLPLSVYMSSSNLPLQLFLNKNVPEQEIGFKAENAVVTVQDIDFKDHVAHGTAKIPSWEWTGELPKPEEPEPEPDDRISRPVLTVVEYSFSSRNEAYVSWEPVEGASGYLVLVDGQETSFENNRVNLSGMKGEVIVSVTAISAAPAILGDSLPSVVVVNLNTDFGQGTEDDPYRIYTAADWIDFCATINEGAVSYKGEYVKVMNDIDFNGAVILPAGAVGGTVFEGSFDGANHTMKNAVVDDSVSPNAGLFRGARAYIRNLTLNKFTVKGYVGGGVAAFVGGTFSGTISNCIVDQCKIYGIGQSVSDAAKDAGLVAKVADENTSIVDCVVRSSEIQGNGKYVAGIVAEIKKGTVRGCTVSDNKIYTTNWSSGGIAGYVAEGAVVDCCISKSNRLTTDNRHMGGLVSDLALGSVMNSISDSNILVLGENSYRTSGGLVGCVETNSKAETVILNCISRGNYISFTHPTRADAFLALGVASDNGVTGNYTMANCFIESGTIQVAAVKGWYVGIVLANLDTGNLSNCYYHEELRKTVDVSEVPVDRYGIGGKSEGANSDAEGTIAVSAADISATSGDNALITRLNSYVNDNKSSYPQLKNWKMEGGFPTLDL